MSEEEVIPVVEAVDENIATPDLPTKEEFDAMTEDEKVEMAKSLNNDRAEALTKLATTLVTNNNIGTLAMAITKAEALLRISVTLHQIGHMDNGDPQDIYAIFPPSLRGHSVVDCIEKITRKEKGLFSNRERHFLRTVYEVFKIRTKNAALKSNATDVLDEASIAEPTAKDTSVEDAFKAKGIVDEQNNEGDLVDNGPVAESDAPAEMDGVPISRIQHMRG